MTQRKVKLEYSGSKFWLVFWAILWIPIALILLITQGHYEDAGKRTTFAYGGSTWWLCVWTLLFWPVAAILLFLNGFEVLIDQKPLEG